MKNEKSCVKLTRKISSQILVTGPGVKAEAGLRQRDKSENILVEAVRRIFEVNSRDRPLSAVPDSLTVG